MTRMKYNAAPLRFLNSKTLPFCLTLACSLGFSFPTPRALLQDASAAPPASRSKLQQDPVNLDLENLEDLFRPIPLGRVLLFFRKKVERDFLGLQHG